MTDIITNDNVYIKHNVPLHEYTMHKYVYDLNIVNTPEIINYDTEKRILTMRKINNMNISDMYGENASNVDEDIFDKIRTIIKILAENNIEYPDITGYNFIEYNDKIWIIDFEHAKISKKIENKFINKFIRGLNKWNPDFK
jgi:tRNA A-37 threonylcarbamoyl transferase component Bud32